MDGGCINWDAGYRVSHLKDELAKSWSVIEDGVCKNSNYSPIYLNLYHMTTILFCICSNPVKITPTEGKGETHFYSLTILYFN